MDNDILEIYSKRADVQAMLKKELEIFDKQSDCTKLVIAEKAFIRTKISAIVIEDLIDEIIDLEDKNKILTEKVKFYKKKHKPFYSSF